MFCRSSNNFQIVDATLNLSDGIFVVAHKAHVWWLSSSSFQPISHYCIGEAENGGMGEHITSMCEVCAIYILRYHISRIIIYQMLLLCILLLQLDSPDHILLGTHSGCLYTVRRSTLSHSVIRLSNKIVYTIHKIKHYTSQIEMVLSMSNLHSALSNLQTDFNQCYHGNLHIFVQYKPRFAISFYNVSLGSLSYI